jgi:hypothetical protein
MINMMKITAREAVEFMRDGQRCLTQLHTHYGMKWFLVPGGPVTEKIAKALLEHPHIQPNNDGLFPGISQTFRFKAPRTVREGRSQRAALRPHSNANTQDRS